MGQLVDEKEGKLAVLHSLQQIMSHVLIKGEERPAAVAQVLLDYLEEFSPNADWLFGKRMRKT